MEQKSTRALSECIIGSTLARAGMGWGGMNMGEGGSLMPGTDWRAEGEYFAYGNCDYSCPRVFANLATPLANGDCLRVPSDPINSDRVADGNPLSHSAAKYPAPAASIAARPSPGMNFGGNRK